ncbi:MAG: hypothetical protein R3Y49_04890 [Rikenellaceae bacterium]
MYTLGITFVVEPQCEASFWDYFKGEIVTLANNQPFKLFRVLSEHYQGHFSFTLQIKLSGIAQYTEIKTALDNKKNELEEKFGSEGVLHFATLLKEIEI